MPLFEFILILVTESIRPTMAICMAIPRPIWPTCWLPTHQGVPLVGLMAVPGAWTVHPHQSQHWRQKTTIIEVYSMAHIDMYINC